MIFNKYFDIHQSSISLSANLMSFMKVKKKASIDEVFVIAKSYIKNCPLELIQESISYLFLLGLVRYNPESDSLEYINEN